MGETLKPCPFCGEIPQILKHTFVDGLAYTVGCKNKRCVVQITTIPYPTEKLAIKTWNTKANDVFAKMR